jgi:hypothetical protein
MSDGFHFVVVDGAVWRFTPSCFLEWCKARLAYEQLTYAPVAKSPEPHDFGGVCIVANVRLDLDSDKDQHDRQMSLTSEIAMLRRAGVKEET